MAMSESTLKTIIVFIFMRIQLIASKFIAERVLREKSPKEKKLC